MIQYKKLIMTLALLMTAATGAWAESKPIGLNVEYAVGDVITSTTDVYVYYGEHPTNHKQMAVKITSTGPLTISMIFDDSFGFNGDDAVYYLPDGNATGGSAGVIPCVGESTGDATVVHVASGTGTLTDPYVFGSGPFGTPVPLTRGTGEKINEWTLTNGMPAGNVTVSVEYYPQAALTAAPTAINDVPATTDGAIVKAGTVANIGSTETAQGTVMYYVSPTALDDAALLVLAADKWTADVPTAEKLTKGQAYVYYYVRGNDSDTDEENFSDGDILAANALTVTIAAEPTYAVTFNAANANTIEAGKATVTVGGTDKTGDITEGKLQGVKMGSEVKVKANTGYKFRKVEVKKKEAVTYPLLSAATTSDLGKVVCAAGHLHDAKTAVPDGCTAVGIVGKVTSTGHGLILALKDATSQNWNTINGWTSASYAGTTLKVLPDAGARGTNLTSYTTLGETTVSNWAVAQKSDYEAIFQNLGSTINDGGYTYDGNVNAYITTGVGGTAITSGYWSATYDGGNNSWIFFSEYWESYIKSNSVKVRPVLGF